MQHMESSLRAHEIEDAVDRLLAPNRPSFRRPPDLDGIDGPAPRSSVRQAAPAAEIAVESDAAMSRIVLVVPRYRGPDAAGLRTLAFPDAGKGGEGGPRATSAATDRVRWTARLGPKGADCETLVEVLGWSDLPQAAIPTAIRGGFRASLRTLSTYASTGAFRRLWHLRRSAVLAGAARFAPLGAQAALAMVAGLASGRMLAGSLAPLADAAGMPGWPVALVGTLAGASAVLLILRAFRRNEDWLQAYDRLRGIAFLASRNGAYPSELEQRIAGFAERIGWALRQPVREVVVVGQGDGAALAVSALCEAVRWGELPDGAPAVSLLTLGQTIPLIGFLPDAGRLRADLRDMSLRRDICWVDMSDPEDLHAFALSDPVAVCGVAPEDRVGPLVLRAAPRRGARPGARDVARDHGLTFQDRYLDARPDGGRDPDWRRVLFGGLPVRRLLGGRPPSAGRIDVRGSAYVGTSRPRPEPDEDED